MDILDLLNRETDEEHMLTAPEIKERFAERGINADKKSIARDIDLLVQSGYDIRNLEESYYMGKRAFEESELRILMDAVIASKCINRNKSRDLVKKLEALGSRHMEERFCSKISADEKVKCINEELYSNLNKINRAISKNSKITFKCYSYEVNKDFSACKEGKSCEINPFAVVCYEEFYYLIGMHDRYNEFAHYRVDKIKDIVITEEKRKDIGYIPEHRNGFDAAHYMKSAFKTFAEEKDRIEIKFSNSLINEAIDRFGESVTIRRFDNNYFVLSANTYGAEGFVPWILQFGGKAEVLYPEKLRGEIKAKVKELKELYLGKAI